MDKKYLLRFYFKNDVEFDELDNGKIVNDEPFFEVLTNEFNYTESLHQKLQDGQYINKYISTELSFVYSYEFYNNKIVQLKKHLGCDNFVILFAEVVDSYLDEYNELVMNTAKPRWFSNLTCKQLSDNNGVITYIGTIDSVNHIQSYNNNLNDEIEYKEYKSWLLNKLKKLFLNKINKGID